MAPGAKSHTLDNNSTRTIDYNAHQDRVPWKRFRIFQQHHFVQENRLVYPPEASWYSRNWFRKPLSLAKLLPQLANREVSQVCRWLCKFRHRNKWCHSPHTDQLCIRENHKREKSLVTYRIEHGLKSSSIIRLAITFGAMGLDTDDLLRSIIGVCRTTTTKDSPARIEKLGRLGTRALVGGDKGWSTARSRVNITHGPLTNGGRARSTCQEYPTSGVFDSVGDVAELKIVENERST